MFIDSQDTLNEERLKMLEKYGGPFNDFYRSKGLGIPLKNIYSDYLTIDKNLYSKPVMFHISSNGLDGEGLHDTTFDIAESQFINKNILFYKNVKFP